MEVKRYLSICLLASKMRKDLFGIDTNNSTDGVGLLFPKMTNFHFSSECKKINTDKWKKIN